VRTASAPRLQTLFGSLFSDHGDRHLRSPVPKIGPKLYTLCVVSCHELHDRSTANGFRIEFLRRCTRCSALDCGRLCRCIHL